MKILITGATDGIGRALTADYARAGAQVLATGRRADPDLPRGVNYVRADQSDAPAAARTIEAAVLRLGGVDAVVLNAGLGFVGDPGEDARIAEQIETNLTATILIARVVAPFVLASGGSLVLVGSTARTAPNFAAYAATKAGLAGFVRSLEEEWRGRAHTAILHPGPTRTAMHEKAGLTIGPMRRAFLSPETVARGIERAVRRRSRSRNLTRAWCWTAPKLALSSLA